MMDRVWQEKEILFFIYCLNIASSDKRFVNSSLVCGH